MLNTQPRRPKDPTPQLVFAGVGFVIGLIMIIAMSAAGGSPGLGVLLLLVSLVWAIIGIVRLVKVKKWVERRQTNR